VSERIYLSPPDVGPLERDALLRAFDSGWVAPAGPELDAFEQDIAALLEWPGAVALSSGTAALHLALLVHGVTAGDRVFVSDFTFAATANAVTYCGAESTFIDSEATSWNMSPQLLADALANARSKNELPAAVIVVDLYGQCADYDQLVPQCHELGIPVIEDAAEALLATYKGRPAGTLGDCGIFSFNGNKIMTTSGGGMFVSPTTQLSDRVRYLSTQARQPALHYEHSDIGFNYRLSNLLAAMGRAQLSRVSDMSDRRIAVNQMYRAAFADLPVTFMPTPPEMTWNGWLTCVTFETTKVRDRVIDALAAQQIESRQLWKPMHMQPVFADSQSFENGVSESLFHCGLCLPSGSGLVDAQVERVADLVAKTLVTQLR